MTSLPGGAADKAGNRYEQLWTALRIGELLQGRASRLRLEPPGETGTGIEFEIDVDGVTWGEQAKSSPSTWTIHKLNREAVLSVAKIQLDFGRHYRLIVAGKASELADLSDRARATSSIDEFTELIGASRSDDFAKLVTAWDVSREDAWALLKRVEVTHLSNDALSLIVVTNFRQLYVEDPGLVLAELRSFCDTHLHETLTGPQVAEHLRAKGFQRRLLVGDRDTLMQLHATVDRHRRRVDHAAPSMGFVPRDDVDALLKKLVDADAPQLTIVDGGAGSGKSTVVADAAATLEAEGWFVAVARMDTDATMTTSAHLGRELGLTDSPSVLLAGVADGSPALVIIDQLDAVSLYSGRMADNFDAVAELLTEIERYPNVKALLVARAVDLEVDPRLRALLQPKDRVGRHTVGPLDIDDVCRHLDEHDIAVPASAATVELLRTPLHLAVFTRLSADARALTYRTLPELYDRYTDELRRRVEDRIGHLDWVRLTGALVGHMNEHEVLAVPSGVLDEIPRNEVQALESESVLVRDETAVSFFHESYFDYLFARSFVTSGGDLHAFLTDSGQHLFRRAQTRQVLEYLAATDRDRFRTAIVGLLAADDIRAHLKQVVVQVLRAYDPDPEDWAALDDLAWKRTDLGSQLIGLLNQPGWFDAANELGLWEHWLAEPDTVDRAFNELVFAARQRGRRAAELVRPHIGTSEEWRLRLRGMISWSLNPELVDLAVELVGRRELDDTRGPIAVNSDFWSIVHGFADEDPDGAARLTGAFLRRGLERAQAEGSDDPFASGHISEHSQTASVIVEIAAQAPTRFLEEVLPFVVTVATADQHEAEGFLPRGRRWAYRHKSADFTVDDIIFSATDDALCQLAGEDPPRFEEVITELRNVESNEVRFLACRALTAGVGSGTRDADEALDWLLGDPRNLALGWIDSPRWAARELIEACSKHCSAAHFERLEAVLLDHWPVGESRRAHGRAQYEFLSALDLERMSEPACRRLGELERRFPQSPPKPPQPMEAHFVGPPISDEASTHMSDNDWLWALRKHSADDADWSGDVPVGGARELAQVLGRRAKEHPERFARVALRFRPDIPAHAINQVINSVAGEIALDLLADLCDHAAHLYGPAVGRAVCSAARTVGAADNRLVALVEHYARNVDPDHESARTTARPDDQYLYGGDLFTAGLNSTRGEAALAAASILFSAPELASRLGDAVEALALDDILAVRVCAAEAVIALLNPQPQRALDTAERLFDTSIDVFDAPTTARLFAYSVLRQPERFAPLLGTALDGRPNVGVRAGRVWAVARINGAALGSHVPSEVGDLPAAARAGAAGVFAANTPDALEELAELFGDADADVRQQAARAMRELDQISDDDLDAMIAVFARSTAFADHMEWLLRALEERQTRLPLTTIDVCERAVEVAGAALGDIQTARSASTRELNRLILRLYRQGDATLRRRCLDLVDRLIELNVYDVERFLEDER